MNFKLFMVMGLTWTMHNISAYVDGIKDAPKWTEIVFYVTDTINYMQGIFIFLLFICKRNIYLLFIEHLRSLNCCLRTFSNK